LSRRDEIRQAPMLEDVTEFLRGRVDEGQQLVGRLRPGFDRRAPGQAQHSDGLDGPVLALRDAGLLARESGAGRRFSVSGIGLTVTPAPLSIGAVDLDHHDAFSA
jgi:hypothetical protein